MIERRKPPHLSERLSAIWDEIEPTLFADTPASVVEALCTQVKTLRDAREKIESDGVIVVDAKNNAVEHPACATERAALKIISDLNKVWSAMDDGDE